jgi:hypothetical protein
MNVSTRVTVALSAALLGAGAALGTPAAAATAPGGATAHVAGQTDRARLWTQVGSGANGYTDIVHAYRSVGHGLYTGKVSGTLNHYHAPKNRQVVVVFRIDGRLGGYSKATKSNHVSFSKTYSKAKKVSARICLHRPGVAIKLNSGVSYCSAWWG